MPGESYKRRWTRNGYVAEPASQQEIDDIVESIERLSDLVAEQKLLIHNLSTLVDEALGRVDSVETSLGWWEARK